MRHHASCCTLESGLESLYTGHGADLYDALCQGDVGGLTGVIDALHEAGARTVVDLGAGAGRVTLPLLEAGFDVIGVDLSTDMLTLLERRAAELGLADHLDVVHADMVESVGVCEAADAVLVVTSNLTMFGPAERGRLLRNARSLLRPGGLLLVEIYQIDPATPELGTLPMTTRGTFTERVDEARGYRRVTVALDGHEFVSTTWLVDAPGISAEITEAFGPEGPVLVTAEPVAPGRWNVHLRAVAPPGTATVPASPPASLLATAGAHR